MVDLHSLLGKNSVIVIESKEQEKQLADLCKKQNIEFVKKDSTAYWDSGKEKQPIYPIYYGFLKSRLGDTTWWSVNPEFLKEHKVEVVNANFEN